MATFHFDLSKTPKDKRKELRSKLSNMVKEVADLTGVRPMYVEAVSTIVFVFLLSVMIVVTG